MFIRGETSGIKISPDNAAKEMRSATTGENTKMFIPQEYLIKSQIQSLFSRMSAAQKCGKLLPPEIKEVEDMFDEEYLRDDARIIIWGCFLTAIPFRGPTFLS